jgi:murein DD-endopeptidase / murein LD-carboxypeptidase
MSARMIQKRALAQIGVPYRLHGRLPGVALDCVGLAGFAAFGTRAALLPIDYGLRGDYSDRLDPYFSHARFRRYDGAKLAQSGPVQAGDIVLCQTAVRQLHLMVCVTGGYVHGHAGLRRIVFTPLPSPWPILCLWRPRVRNYVRKKKS